MNAKQHAERLGVTLELEITGIHCQLDAVAPDGHCFEPSLHCITAFCYKGKTRKETVDYLHKEIAERLSHYDRLEKCDEKCECH